MKKVKTIYELLNSYTKEEIDDAIKMLNEFDRNLIYLRYGEYLENPNPSNWDKKYNNRFYICVITKIKNIINSKRKGWCVVSGGKRVVTLYEKFRDYKESEIDYVISLLDPKEQDLIYLRFGNDLNNPNISNWQSKYFHELYNVYRKIQTKLKNLQGKQIKISTIYELLSPYSKEEIDLVLNSLDETDSNLIYLRYGAYLENPCSSNWKKEYRTDFYRSLIPKIRVKLKNNRKKEKDVYEKFRDTYLKEVKDLTFKINSLNNIDLELNYDNPNLALLKKVLIVLQNIKNEHKELFDMITLKEYLIFVVTMKMDKYNLNDVMKLFNVNKEEIDKIKYNILSLLKYGYVENTVDELNQESYFLKLVKNLKTKINSDYKDLLQVFKEREILIFILVKSINDSYNLKDIEDYFNISSDEIRKIVTKLLSYVNYQEKGYFNDFYELIKK